ncbi:hypothetical protein P74p67 [Thermus phage P74-26]|uniref:Uncharacterized protein n=1 Tax=Thermus phage P74-26 TaxID=2914007 RepID=A7XXP1_BP742|nr:hypothetical protein P74p67 [Thermus phage P74-26]ABU97017.1 hypothetical protein P74p67 [Thermus phage P74-26]
MHGTASAYYTFMELTRVQRRVATYFPDVKDVWAQDGVIEMRSKDRTTLFLYADGAILVTHPDDSFSWYFDGEKLTLIGQPKPNTKIPAWLYCSLWS